MAKKKPKTAKRFKAKKKVLPKSKLVTLAPASYLKFLTNHPAKKVSVVCLSLSFLLYPGHNLIQALPFAQTSSPLQPAPFALNSGPEVPIPTSQEFPAASAKSIYIQDLNSAAIIHQKDPYLRLAPASTTKIMSALIVLETYRLNDIVTVKNLQDTVGRSIKLYPAETLTVLDLLYAMLMPSGNDAALALAQHHPQGYSGFVDAMNQKAIQMQLQNTHFTNASGLDNPNHYTSAFDLSLITRKALEHQIFRDITATKTHTIKNSQGTVSHYLENSNLLLGTIEGVEGVKTGYTSAALECLVTLVNRQNHPVLLVMLGSNDRFGESSTLIDWIYQYHQWQTIEAYYDLDYDLLNSL